MPTQNKLSLFWGYDKFHFVETVNNIPTQIFSTPFEPAYHTTFSSTRETTKGIHLAEIIQTAIRNRGISTNQISIALPSKDIIFRSFVVPWMQSSEIKGMVEFEAAKYVPFKLDELYFTHHAMAFTENKKRQIIILFAAIKKDILDSYCSVLEHCGLHINFIEPASMSLIRALAYTKNLSKTDTVAIIDSEDIAGRIIIVENNVPQFVREFPLLNQQDDNKGQAATNARLFNEVRISLDYYSRQHPHKTIKKIIILSARGSDHLLDSLSSYLRVPVSILKSQDVLKTTESIATGAIIPYGTCLRQTTLTNIRFDLPWKSRTTADTLGFSSDETAPDYKKVWLTAFICAAVILGSLNLTKQTIQNYQNKVSSLKTELGAFEGADINQLSSKNSVLSENLKEYQGLRDSSEIYKYLSLITHLLPEGVWLNTYALNYTSNVITVGGSNMEIQMSGFVYHENIDRQIRLVNTFIQQLKSENQFSKNFKNIDLASVNRSEFERHPVTSFSITCK
jgi:Tfp pilus assembly protein PilN